MIRKNYEVVVEFTVLINAIYLMDPAGGALHIVLDDGNTEDEFIKWCMENSIAELVGREHDIYYRCAELLLAMPERDRMSVITDYFKYDYKWGGTVR